jgi:RNA polymerase sigma-70 factor (ECF subfamily)
VAPEVEPRAAATPAFGEVVERYADFVYNVAYRMLNNQHDADDAAQDAFLSAHRAWERFKGQSEVSTWLYRITVNACLMRLRKEKRSRQLVDTGYEDMDVPDWRREPEGSALDQELHGAITDGLTRLPGELRAAVVLRDVQDLNNLEAAEILEISVSALKARLHRGRVLLRKHLEGYLRS